MKICRVFFRLMFSPIKCLLGQKTSLQEQNKATVDKSRNTQREKNTRWERPLGLIRHSTDVCIGRMNEHYHLDSGSFVRQLSVDVCCRVLEVSSLLWAHQYSLQ